MRVADGVDVRADGGYVVGAGSLHPSGTRYAVENGGEPRALPPEVVPMLTTPAPPPPAQPGTLPDVIPQGRRDTTLFRYACALEARGVGDGEALPLLREAWARCSPPYTEKSPEQMWSAVVAATVFCERAEAWLASGRRSHLVQTAGVLLIGTLCHPPTATLAAGATVGTAN